MNKKFKIQVTHLGITFYYHFGGLLNGGDELYRLGFNIYDKLKVDYRLKEFKIGKSDYSIKIEKY